MTIPKPESEKLSKYYESENYISHTNEANNVVNRLYKLARVFTIREKSNLLQERGKKGRLLDIGCGTGDFLFYNQKKGWETAGVEVNESARKMAESKLKQDLYSRLSNVDNSKPFSAITLWHVLEHVESLEDTCNIIRSLLSPEGTLLVAVPNYESYDARYYQQYWAAYDLPRHLHHFTKKSMAKLWHKYGMNIESVIPMKLDSYYVSMLSEQYKTGKVNLIKAGIVATKSNMKARASVNYSSLIYVIRK